MTMKEAVEHWRKCQKNGWDLDATTLRHLKEDIEAGLAEHRRVEGTLTTDEQRQTWDEAFAEDVAEAEKALAEIKKAMEILANVKVPYPVGEDDQA